MGFAFLPFPVTDHGLPFRRYKPHDRRGEASWSTFVVRCARPWAGADDGAKAVKGNPRRPDGPVALLLGDP